MRRPEMLSEKLNHLNSASQGVVGGTFPTFPCLQDLRTCVKIDTERLFWVNYAMRAACVSVIRTCAAGVGF